MIKKNKTLCKHKVFSVYHPALAPKKAEFFRKWPGVSAAALVGTSCSQLQALATQKLFKREGGLETMLISVTSSGVANKLVLMAAY